MIVDLFGPLALNALFFFFQRKQRGALIAAAIIIVLTRPNSLSVSTPRETPI